MNDKKIFGRYSLNKQLLAIFILLISIPVTVILVRAGIRLFSHAATGNGTVYFQPASANLPPDTAFKIMIDPSGSPIGFVRVDVKFDTFMLHMSSEIVPAPTLGTVIQKTSMASANSTGVATIVLGLSPDQLNNPPTTAFEVATVTFAANQTIASGNTSVTFDPLTMQVLDLNNNILNMTIQPLSITINTNSCTSNSQCMSGQICVNGTCVPAPTVTPTACTSDTQCPSGQLCIGGYCVVAVPTPTPIGFCTSNSQCLAGQVCVNGSCVVPTPTPSNTPTPTPTHTPTPTPTRTPTPTPTSTPTPTLSPTPSPTPIPSTLTLKVRLQGITYQTNIQYLSVIFRRTSDNTVVYSNVLPFTSDSAGTYTSTFTPPFPVGIYDVLVKSITHLQKKFAAIQTSASNQTLDLSPALNQELKAADVNADNKLTLEDITAVVNARGSSFSVPVTSANQNYDINADGNITVLDIALAMLNWSDLVVPGDQ